MKTEKEFNMIVADAERQYPQWRYGQTLFNVALSVFPEFAESIRGTDADPFFMPSDDTEKFVTKLREYLRVV